MPLLAVMVLTAVILFAAVDLFTVVLKLRERRKIRKMQIIIKRPRRDHETIQVDGESSDSVM